jgi:hypothetical protein
MCEVRPGDRRALLLGLRFNPEGVAQPSPGSPLRRTLGTSPHPG